jgi:FHA domain/Double zinc ribbon
MDARFYNSEDIDIERLASDLVNVYLAQGYQAQQIGNKDQMMVQLKKGGDFEAIIGMQAALTVTIQRTAGGTLAMIGQQKWLDKAAVGAVGVVAMPVLWPLMLTAGVGAVRQASLSNQVLNIVDGLVRQQRPGLLPGQIPVQLMPQVQQMWSPPPPSYTPPYVPGPQVVNALPAPPPASAPAPRVSGQLRCPDCNTPYEEGDTFCTGCGRSLKLICPNCKAELKPDASFCPKCGASTYQSMTATVAAQPAPPAPAPAPAPQTPLYTPPPQPVQPQTPLYTPPPQPQPQARPQVPSYTPSAQPAPPPAPPKPQPYVPPTPQEPVNPPTPTVTYVPAAPKQETPKPQPQRQQAPLYVPPVQPQQVTPKPQTPAASATPPKPIQARPTSQPLPNANSPWGSLTFNNGQQIALSGERAVVGRYDHDLGGITPEVDLSQMEGADTVSRIHATLEHIGSSFTVTDLNSTNATRLNGKRLEPDKATPLNEGDTLTFGKVTCTFKKA